MVPGIFQVRHNPKFACCMTPDTAKNICFQEPSFIWGEASLRLGKNIHVGRGTEIMAEGGITIGDNVVISYQCVLWSIDHRYEGEALPYDRARIRRPIVIGDNVWIGRNAIVRGGVTIGEGAVVAMGSVVTRDVPPLAVVGGNPAHVLRFRDVRCYFDNKRAGRSLWDGAGGCGACAGEFFVAEADPTPSGTFARLATWLRLARWRLTGRV